MLLQMTTSNTTLRASFLSMALLLSAMAACHDPLPCPDCDEADIADEPNDTEPMPDLPCGGADLVTDNSNCGACGNQ